MMYDYTCFDAVSDALIELDVLKSDDQKWEIVSNIPRWIVEDANEWGWSDTVVWEAVFDYIVKEVDV